MATYKAYSALKTWTTNNWVYDLGAGGLSGLVSGDILTITGAGAGAGTAPTGAPNGFRPGVYTVGQFLLGYATATPDGAQNLAHLDVVPVNDGTGARSAAVSGGPQSGQISGGTGYVGVLPSLPAVLRVGALGDSITNMGYWIPAFQSALAAVFGCQAAQIVITNNGLGGRTSTNFLPTVAQGGEDFGLYSGGAATGQSDLQAAIASFNAAGCTVVMILLGANDSKSGSVQTSVGTYQGNIQAICAAIALGCPLVKLILLNAPFSPLPGAGGAWDGTSVAILPRYGVALRLVSVPSGVVRLGDTTLPAIMLATPSLTVDLVHPGSGAGGNLVGAAWAAALVRALASWGPAVVEGFVSLSGGAGVLVPVDYARGTTEPEPLEMVAAPVNYSGGRVQ